MGAQRPRQFVDPNRWAICRKPDGSLVIIDTNRHQIPAHRTVLEHAPTAVAARRAIRRLDRR